MIDDERFYKLVNKEIMDKEVEELARETQTRCGLILLKSLTFNHEEMKELNSGPTQDMSDFCMRFEQAVTKRILEIGQENAVEARESVEDSRRNDIHD